MTHVCEKCGQTSTEQGPCAECVRARYGGGESHESVRLFAPAPAVMEGQIGLPLEKEER